MDRNAATFKALLARKRNRYMFAGALLLGIATPSFALFGIGDIVFDPSNYGEAIATVANLAKLYSTATNEYNAIAQNVKNFSLKTMWQTQLNQIKTVSVVNSYGETAGFSSALNSDSTAAASTAWKASGIAISPDAHNLMSSQSVGNSSQLAQLAVVEASDATSPDCLNAVGAYRQARQNAVTAEQSLQNAQVDGTDTTNSEVEQLNLLNVAQAQQLNETQAQGALHTCLAEQMTVQNMQQRNVAADDLNTWGTVQTQHLTNPSFNDATTSTWTTYIP